MLELTESQLRSNIVRVLKRRKWLVMPLTERSSSGYPDMMIIKDGRVVFVELKRQSGKIEPIQLYWNELLKKNGVEAYFVRSVDDIKKIIIGG